MNLETLLLGLASPHLFFLKFWDSFKCLTIHSFPSLPLFSLWVICWSTGAVWPRVFWSLDFGDFTLRMQPDHFAARCVFYRVADASGNWAGLRFHDVGKAAGIPVPFIGGCKAPKCLSLHVVSSSQRAIPSPASTNSLRGQELWNIMIL